MGLFDRLTGASPRRRSPQEVEPEPVFELTVTIGEESSSFSIPFVPDDYGPGGLGGEGPEQSAVDCWHALGEPVEVAGRRIGGGVYVGSGLRGADSNYIREPSLIVPELPVADSTEEEIPERHYWPSYDGLDEGHRGAYLDWLAGPRRAERAPETYLFIYLYGLERRLLADPGEDGDAAAERAGLIAELERLASEVGEDSAHSGFAHHCRALLSFLDAQDLLREVRRVEPPTEPSGWEVPGPLKLMIGELAAAGRPLPAELALSWTLTSPEAYLRTPAQRCREEFATLFALRYRETHGEGIALLRPQKKLKLSYSPSSQGLREVGEQTGVPDVTGTDALIEPLRELGRHCCTELDPFSRWLGRNPEQRGGLQSLALLPAPLLAEAESAELDALRRMLAEITATEEPWFFDQGELIELWSPGAEKLPKKEAVMASQLVEALGFAIEPDQRFGGPSPRPGTPAVLFESNEGDPRSPSPAYAVAGLLLHLMSAVAAADGKISSEEELLLSHIHGVEELYPGERARLQAHASWLTRSKPKFNGMRKKLEQLNGGQREGLARSLIALAAADGEVTPEEVKVLSKIFDLLGLDPKRVYSELHSAGSADPGERSPLLGSDGEGESRREDRQGRALDRAAIDRKVEETALVSTMLAGIFEDHEASDTGPATPSPAASPATAGAPDRELLRRLCEREQWPRQDLEALAAELDVLIDGAIERLNDEAFESCEEPLAEGDDPLYIDKRVGEELLG